MNPRNIICTASKIPYRIHAGSAAASLVVVYDPKSSDSSLIDFVATKSCGSDLSDSGQSPIKMCEENSGDSAPLNYDSLSKVHKLRTILTSPESAHTRLEMLPPMNQLNEKCPFSQIKLDAKTAEAMSEEASSGESVEREGVGGIDERRQLFERE
ncbi:hypothetical protein KIN20_009009 [Parelaphostrongylus tenuis]|uniref:Uncharacterized protein n=1 Tax=Parelaphostrongylus tenuis TaxID=148309 RepID=A0AAD5QKA3_PARTN|nr:hypothetical protein KIN20_009009 [Parelaphostrongylus tenuis]